MSMFADSIKFATKALQAITSRPEYSIIQVGSHIGNNSNDCLYQSILRNPVKVLRTVVLVEPIPEFFEGLKNSYHGAEGVHFENVAISDVDCISDFYYLPFDASKHGYPHWLNQLGSLGEELLLRDTNGKQYEWHEFYMLNRVKIQVQCRTLDFVLSKYNLDNLDALFIDAEGHDARILTSLDLESLRPSYIHFESSLLSPEEKQTTVNHLVHCGYHVRDIGFDTIACMPDLTL